MMKAKYCINLGLVLLMLLCNIPLADATTYTYDELGRLTSASFDNGKKIIYSYDAGGNILTINSSATQVDMVSPAVYATFPENGSTDISVNQAVYVTFSENVVQSTNFNGINIKSGDTVVDATYSINECVLAIQPKEPLNYNTTYSITIPKGAVMDLAENKLTQDFIISFTTCSEPVINHSTVNLTDPNKNNTAISFNLTSRKFLSYIPSHPNLSLLATKRVRPVREGEGSPGIKAASNRSTPNWFNNA